MNINKIMMVDCLPDWPLLSVFLTASLILAVTPGPGVLYIVMRSLSQGRWVGCASVAGIALGNLGNMIGASLGFAALFAVVPGFFVLMKYIGAFYLIFIGLKTLRLSHESTQISELKKSHLSVIFRDGFIVALLNPKTAIFFAAFIPQFIHSKHLLLNQSLILGVIFVGIAAITDTLYALVAGSMGPLIFHANSISRVGHSLTGSILIGLGVFTALSGLHLE